MALVNLGGGGVALKHSRSCIFGLQLVDFPPYERLGEAAEALTTLGIVVSRKRFPIDRKA